MRILVAIGVLSTLLCASPVWAQYPEDAYRLGAASLGVGARAIGMGSAFLPVADDFSALYWNPAGLGQLKMREISFGLSRGAYSTTTTFLSAETPGSTSTLQFDNFGVVIPGSSHYGGIAFAVGYNKTQDFTADARFNGFNSSSSLIDYEVRFPSNSSDDLLQKTGVAGVVNGKLVSPIKNNIQQSGEYLEGGSIHAFSIGGAGEVAEGLDLGVALNIFTGGYTYHRQLHESDMNNVYQVWDSTGWTNLDLAEFRQDDDLTSSITGVGLTVGMLYRLQDVASFGLTVSTPSSFAVHEEYSTTMTSSFDDGSSAGPNSHSDWDEYDVTTPMKIAGGFAVHPIPFLTASASAEFADNTLLEFGNPSSSGLLVQNSNIRTLFRSTLNYHLGAEYKFAPLGIGVRGGYQFLQSPYATDASSAGQKFITLGASAVLAKKAVIELAYVMGTGESAHVNYDNSSTTQESIKMNNVYLTFALRF